MIPAIHTHLPPEIYRLVARAGAQHCLWWSNRWRRGTKPSTGQSAREMTNTVPGSPITATQPTATAQPISVSEGMRFEGDDVLNGGVLPNVDAMTLLGVARVDQSVIDNDRDAGFFGVTNGSSDQFGQVFFRGSNPQIRCEPFDGTNNTPDQVLLGIGADTWVAFGATFLWSSDTISYTLTARSPGMSETTSSSGPYTNAPQDRQYEIGRRHSTSVDYLAGDKAESGMFPTHISDSDLESAIDRLAHRHGIT